MERKFGTKFGYDVAMLMSFIARLIHNQVDFEVDFDGGWSVFGESEHFEDTINEFIN